MIDFTTVSRNIGSLIAQLKNNNKLIDELNKVYNPTFVEILEDLQENDKTLGTMLLMWYCNKYDEREIKMDDLISKIKTEKSPKVKPSKTYSYSSGCGNNGGSVGCGVTPKKSSGGCGGSYNYNDSHC